MDEIFMILLKATDFFFVRLYDFYIKGQASEYSEFSLIKNIKACKWATYCEMNPYSFERITIVKFKKKYFWPCFESLYCSYSIFN